MCMFSFYLGCLWYSSIVNLFQFGEKDDEEEEKQEKKNKNPLQHLNFQFG